MTVDQLNRKMSFVATCFAFLGVILGVIALTTNYWTEQKIHISPNKAVEISNGTNFTRGETNEIRNVSFLLQN